MNAFDSKIFRAHGYALNFPGLSGDVVMSGDADRYAAITVFDLSESGNFTTVAFYRMAIVNGTIFPVLLP